MSSRSGEQAIRRSGEQAPGLRSRAPGGPNTIRVIERRRFILRVILISLAVAAVAGVMAALFAADEILMRVMGTGLITAMAAGVVAGVAPWTDRPSTRTAGLAAIALVVAEHLVFLALIWGSQVRAFTFEEEVLGTTGALAAAGIPAVAALRFIAAARSRAAGRALLAASIVAFGVFLVAAWYPRPLSFRHEQLWGSGWTVVAHGIMLAATLVVPPTPRPWRWSGVVLVPLSCITMLAVVWEWIQREETLVLTLGPAIVVAFASAILLVPTRGAQRLVPWVAIACAAGLAIDADVMFYFDLENEVTGRLAAALGIVLCCAALATAILGAVNRRMQVDAPAYDLELAVECPRCGRALSLSPGKSRCGSCGLGFSIRVEEPRCRSCNYVLVGLRAERCPECGTPVRQAD